MLLHHHIWPLVGTWKVWFDLPVQKLSDTSVQYLIIQHDLLIKQQYFHFRFLQLQKGSTSVKSLTRSEEASQKAQFV